MISLVHNIGHGLFCQVGNGMYGGNFHFLVDGFCLSIERATEDIGETDYVINLIRIV